MIRPFALALSVCLGFGLPARAQQTVVLAASASASVTNSLVSLHVETTPEALTFKLEASAPVTASEESDDHAFRLKLSGLSVDRALLDPMPLGDRILRSMEWQSEAGGMVLVVPWRYRLRARIVTTGPSTLEITLQKVFNQSLTRVVAPGIAYEQILRGTPEGPLSIHVLRVDPHQPGVRVAPALAEGHDGFGLEPISQMTRRLKAIAGVNGAYFGKGGQPLGLLMIDGNLVTGPIYGRTALVLGKDRSFIERSALSAALKLPDGESVDVDGVNQPRWDDQIVLYTERFGVRTHTLPRPGSVEAAIGPDGRVQAVATADLAIPAGGFVVSAAGRPAAWLSRLLLPGRMVGMEMPLLDYWEGAMQALGGGPRLLSAGVPSITAQAERFPADICVGRSPRTAVGITRAGTLVIVTVDGRDPARSIGVTLDELADLMRELGAQDAMNLDGGGSTTFVLEGRLLNRPSDGFERPVSNGLLIWSDAS